MRKHVSVCDINGIQSEGGKERRKGMIERSTKKSVSEIQGKIHANPRQR